MGAWLRGLGPNRVAAIVGVVVLVLAGTFSVAAILLSRGATSQAASQPTIAPATPTDTATPTAIPSATPIRFAGILDGVPMSDSEWAARKDLLPIAIMIDNSPDAFPQTGLDRADLVYEAFVEGGITRFMAVYWRQEADLVEPVRSARTPFVIWADELGAMYAHAGEADTFNEANAGGQIQEWGIKDLNAFSGPATAAYYRDTDRYAPHNLVASTIALRAAAARLNYAGPRSVERWLFKADGDGTGSYPDAGGIEVNFEGTRNPWQLVQWHWDPETKSYARYEFGGPQVDGKTKQQLTFKNVVVMTVGEQVVDDSGHVLLDQIGTGKATVFLDGKQIDGTWKKAERQARTRFYDSRGAEIAFDRGSTFIEVIGFGSTVTVTGAAAELPKIPEYVPPPPQPADTTAPDDTSTPPAAPTASASASPSRSPSAIASGTPHASGPTTPRPSGTSALPTATATATNDTPRSPLPTATPATPTTQSPTSATPSP